VSTMICERCGCKYEGPSCLRCIWEINWKNAHDNKGQIARMERGSSLAPPVEMDALKGKALFQGTGKVPYETTLSSCTCKDYILSLSRNPAPCKHMYRLASDLGLQKLPKVKVLYEVFFDDMSDEDYFSEQTITIKVNHKCVRVMLEQRPDNNEN